MILKPTRSAFCVCGLSRATLETWIGISFSRMPPGWFLSGFGLACFFTLLMPSTTTRSSSTRRKTAPRLPLSLPASTMTLSPLRILFMTASSQNFRRQRDDLHEALGAQLARDRTEDARADRLQLVVEQHRGVGVELDQRAVRPSHTLGGTHHHRAIDFALLDTAARRGVLDAHLDDVANPGVAA